MFYFHPFFGEDFPFWRIFFKRGLVQLPTRKEVWIWSLPTKNHLSRAVFSPPKAPNAAGAAGAAASVAAQAAQLATQAATAATAAATLAVQNGTKATGWWIKSPKANHPGWKIWNFMNTGGVLGYFLRVSLTFLRRISIWFLSILGCVAYSKGSSWKTAVAVNFSSTWNP